MKVPPVQCYRDNCQERAGADESKRLVQGLGCSTEKPDVTMGNRKRQWDFIVGVTDQTWFPPTEWLGREGGAYCNQSHEIAQMGCWVPCSNESDRRAHQHLVATWTAVRDEGGRGRPGHLQIPHLTAEKSEGNNNTFTLSTTGAPSSKVWSLRARIHSQWYSWTPGVQAPHGLKTREAELQPARHQIKMQDVCFKFWSYFEGNLKHEVLWHLFSVSFPTHTFAQKLRCGIRSLPPWNGYNTGLLEGWNIFSWKQCYPQ